MRLSKSTADALYTELGSRAPTLAVFDTETTGVYNSDRVVEIAIVVVDLERGVIVDEFDTLVNPMRDVGPTRIHGITPSMVSAAPTFDEIALPVARRLNGSILVAHNLAFDTRMMNLEFDRLNGRLDPGTGLCTMLLCGGPLHEVCERYDVITEGQHRALFDARATAQVVLRVLNEAPKLFGLVPANVYLPPSSAQSAFHVLARQMLDCGLASPPLPRTVCSVRYEGVDGPSMSYFDLLSRALDDLVVTPEERAQLTEFGTEMGLSHEEMVKAEVSYLAELVRATLRVRVVTEQETTILRSIAATLNIDSVPLPEATTLPSAEHVKFEGLKVVFTGEPAQDVHHMPRDRIEELARVAGMDPLRNVTKKCDLVVAADPTSMSGKAVKARGYGIPIISYEEFFSRIGMN